MTGAGTASKSHVDRVSGKKLTVDEILAEIGIKEVIEKNFAQVGLTEEAVKAQNERLTELQDPDRPDASHHDSDNAEFIRTNLIADRELKSRSKEVLAERHAAVTALFKQLVITTAASKSGIDCKSELEALYNQISEKSDNAYQAKALEPKEVEKIAGHVYGFLCSHDRVHQ